MTGYYEEKLNEGQKYQDFIIDELGKLGIIVQQYGSRHYQFNKGESRSRYEIKYDSRMSETGNVYIEVAEKANALNENFIKSGIFRGDNTWFYCIGDDTHAYVLTVKDLRLICGHTREWKNARNIKFVETLTSQAYLIPEEYVREYLSVGELVFEKPFKRRS